MNKRLILFFGIVVGVIGLDLITKELAVRYLSDIERVIIIPNYFDLTLVWNRGAAFGIFGQAPEYIRKLILIGASSVAAILTIAYAYFKNTRLSTFELVALALIAGGAIGNLYDRIFIGKVRDFIDVHIHSYHWPAFNIADSAITVGIGLFIIYELFFKKRS
ncbi:signal peptidase II [Persephonella sp. KM09-Lau-8]|uniref:signal peptidase II n=1 Tax=Persephonella sp. KM09-Lau-8 TaxID=1158345 RepID=UPI00049821C9|nr:signal peptidase II [Persephonella sp. KM09-Lau-8]